MRPDPSAPNKPTTSPAPTARSIGPKRVPSKPFERQDGLARADVVAAGMGDRCARDRGDDIRRIEIGDVLACERDLAVAQYGDAIGDLEHLLQGDG